MSMIKTPSFVKKIYPSLHWDYVKKGEKTIYLTFDDGPIPVLTPWVLSVLNKYNVKATFFCVGDNVSKHPEIYAQVIEEGHAVGNHTFNHLNGRKTSTKAYLENVQACSEQVESSLFRPPYGRMKYAQMVALRAKYQVIMWDVLTWDFYAKTSPEQCLQNAIQHTQNGSIVVFHDNLKAEENLRYALPRFVEQKIAEGYRFEVIPIMQKTQ